MTSQHYWDQHGRRGNIQIWEYHGPISKSELMDAMALEDEEYASIQTDGLDDEIEATVFLWQSCHQSL